jgi:hypothetical protein
LLTLLAIELHRKIRMPKFLRLLLQLVGLVKKYEPVAEEVYREAKPVVEAAVKAVKDAKK